MMIEVDLPVGVIQYDCTGVHLMMAKITMFTMMMMVMTITQASCEADVLSCYYLDALNKTKAVLLVR